MRILIYDVETAQMGNIGSICAVGWILLHNDTVVKEGYSLINPRCGFSRQNIKIHGITEDDVADAPKFGEYWDSTLCELMTTSLVLAHNAAFDLSATEQALYTAKRRDPGIDYLDTIPVFKALINSPSYKLTELAALTGYEYNPHNASEDVHALLHVLNYVRDYYQLEDLAELLIRTPVRAENTKTNRYVPTNISQGSSERYPRYSHCEENVETLDCCLANMKICITGDFPGYERSDVERMIKEHGGIPTGSVSGRTDYLIVGTYIDPMTGKPTPTGKYKKASEIMANGGKIKLLSFESFIDLIKNMPG